MAEVMMRRATLPVLAVVWVAFAPLAHAGPPYVTDDPEPVEYRHWELYLATIGVAGAGDVSGTAPHVEVNYGPVPDVQLHVLAPLAYDRPSGGPTSYGPGDLELGAKLRFVQERGARPMVGTFPLVELAVGDAGKGLGTGHVHAFLPIWLQQSSGPWTTYGGGGLWINPGPGNRDYGLFGWLVQRQLGPVALGAEVYYQTADQVDGRGQLDVNLGAVVDFTDHHHLLISVGRSLVGDIRFQDYLAYQLTF
jgi:hypothetical protein